MLSANRALGQMSNRGLLVILLGWLLVTLVQKRLSRVDSNLVVVYLVVVPMLITSMRAMESGKK